MSNFADFSTLLDSLYYTSSTKAKTRLLCEYLARKDWQVFFTVSHNEVIWSG